ncbi:lycopene cyclase domain-containing protein [Microbacterium sp.]
MLSYSLLNVVFLTPVAVLTLLAVRGARPRERRVFWRALVPTLSVLLLDTLVFDNVLIALGIVDYDHSRTLGLRLGIAPLEDFGYSIAAAFGLPALWVMLERRRRLGKGRAKAVTDPCSPLPPSTPRTVAESGGDQGLVWGSMTGFNETSAGGFALASLAGRLASTRRSSGPEQRA